MTNVDQRLASYHARVLSVETEKRARGEDLKVVWSGCMMLDCDERRLWFAAYLNAAAHIAPCVSPRKRTAWAMSMSLIAEQHCDLPEDREMADV